ncbi:MAG: hypothetical protein WBF14_10790, partial [Candidatus Acidiferrales bacterium]
MTKWVDISTVAAAIAGLWAIAIAWWTYYTTVRRDNENQFFAIKSMVEGVKLEMSVMKDWTGAGGEGYSKTLKPEQCPKDWRDPGRIIWKFSYEAIRTFPTSPQVYHLRPVLAPIANLSYSIARLFQLYDEYRSFVQKGPDPRVDPEMFIDSVFHANYQIHVGAIGGKDSEDERCLYKAYLAATVALSDFEKSLKVAPSPPWFLFAHIVSA